MAVIIHKMIAHLVTLTTDGRYSKEVNAIQWNDGETVIDIRTWDHETGHARKGITIRREELAQLIAALMSYAESIGITGDKIERVAAEIAEHGAEHHAMKRREIERRLYGD